MPMFANGRILRDNSSTNLRIQEILGQSEGRKPCEPCFALDGGVIATAAPLVRLECHFLSSTPKN